MKSIYIYSYILLVLICSEKHNQNATRLGNRQNILTYPFSFQGLKFEVVYLSGRKCHSFVEIVVAHMCSPVNLLHIFRTTFYKNTSALSFGFSLV